MTAVHAHDSKVNFTMFFSAMGARLKNLLASALTPEEKLTAIMTQLEVQVQAKRKLAREIGAQMRAIDDPETEDLEPLEALLARREKLVKLGGTLVGKPAKKAQLGQVTQEVKGLDARIASQQATFDTLKESYDLAKANYQEAFAALETVRQNGPAMLKAIQAHKEALKARDSVRNQEAINTSFLNELQAELSGVQAELRSDSQIDDDLNAANPNSIDAALAKLDEGAVDEALMAEFKAESSV